MATSAPPGTAMPTSASPSASASFTPSPTMATTRPSAFSSAMSRALSSGSRSGVVVAQPERLGDHPAGLGVVAGQQDDVAHPSGPQRLHGLGRVVAQLILEDEHGDQPPVDGDEER